MNYINLAKPAIILYVVFICGCSHLKDIKQDNQPATMFGDDYTTNLAKKYFGDGITRGDLENEVLSFDSALRHVLPTPGTDPIANERSREASQMAKLTRDRVVYDMLRISDKLYGDFKDRVFSGKASVDTGFKIMDLALTGTAVALGDKGTKTALAAAATFLTGSKFAIDENFYAKQTITSLVSVMDGLRADTRFKLVQGLKKSPDQFSLSEALALLQEYHRRGSMLEAIVELSRISNQQAADKVQRLSNQETNK